MSEALLRQRSVTELVDTAFRMYRAQWGTLVTCSLLIASPVLLYVALTPDEGWPVLLRTALALLVNGLVGGACAMAVGDTMQDSPTDVANVLRRLRPLLGPLIGATIGALLLMMVGFMIFVIPGLFVIAWTITIPAIVVFESGRNGTDPITRGRDLARGHVLRIWGTLILTTAIVYVLLIAGSAVIWYLVAMLGSAPHASTILSQAFGFVLAPISGLTGSLLYFDLRVRAEGLDLEQRLAALTPAAPELSAPPPS